MLRHTRTYVDTHAHTPPLFILGHGKQWIYTWY